MQILPNSSFMIFVWVIVQCIVLKLYISGLLGVIYLVPPGYFWDGAVKYATTASCHAIHY
jgi:hypothetical protein